MGEFSLIPGSIQFAGGWGGVITELMKSCSFKLSEIPALEQTPLVQGLVPIILEPQRRIEQLEGEVQRLKGVS